MFSCKPWGTDSSGLKTLDNFASGSRDTLNECNGDPKSRNSKGLGVILSALDKKILWYSKKNKEPMLKAIHDGFSAVPPDFQNAFMELGGQIVVSSKSNILCTAQERLAAFKDDKKFSVKELKVLKEGLDEVAACYQFTPPSVYKLQNKRDGQVLSIVLPDDVTEIKHSFVRSFGFLVSQVYARLKVNTDNDEVYWTSTENSKFRTLKQEIAGAFLKDISNTENASRFKSYLANGKASNADKRSFQDFVYAESFDSYYCNAYASGSKNTRNVMKSKFKNTYKAFIGLKSQGFGIVGSADNEFNQEFALASASYDRSGVLGTAAHAVSVGRTRSFADAAQPLTEKMHRVSWYAFADVPGQTRKLSSGLSLGYVPQWIKDAGTSTVQTVQGAGILYGQYYDNTQKSTQKAFDRAGSNPGVMGTVGAVASGVSDGTGYTDTYNNIQKSTDNIYSQVLQGRGTDQPLGYYDTASVVANAAVSGGVRNIPGPVGDLTGIAQDSVSAGKGAKFDKQGDLQPLSTGERWAAGGGALVNFADASGATQGLTDKVLGSGGAVRRFGQQNSEQMSGFGQAAFEQGGRGLSQFTDANRQVQNALSNSQTLSTLNKVADFSGTTKPTTNIAGAIKQGGNAMASGAGNSIDNPTPMPIQQQPMGPTTPSIGPAPQY